MENENNIKISIKLKSTGTKLLANADVIINCSNLGWITIKNFQVWSSINHNKRLNDFINIAPPSFRYMARYMPIVFCEDIKMWEKLEKMIWEKYTTEKNNSAPIDEDMINALQKNE